MCLTIFVQNPSNKKTDVQFVIGFNRDQQTKRQTLQFNQFSDDPNIWAGLDSISKGTWLGINIYTGVFAMLTNFFYENPKFGKSRGKMMHQMLSSKLVDSVTKQNVDEAIYRKLKQILEIRSQYSPFNLVIYNVRSGKLSYICTEKQQVVPRQLQPGTVYGLCNGYIDDIWPKTQKAMKLFGDSLKILEQNDVKSCMDSTAQLFKDKQKFSDDPQQEAQIFVNPYFSTRQQAQRMTKSTFVGVFKKKEDHIELKYRQITYKPKTLQEQIIEGTLTINNSQKFIDQNPQKLKP